MVAGRDSLENFNRDSSSTADSVAFISMIQVGGRGCISMIQEFLSPMIGRNVMLQFNVSYKRVDVDGFGQI